MISMDLLRGVDGTASYGLQGGRPHQRDARDAGFSTTLAAGAAENLGHLSGPEAQDRSGTTAHRSETRRFGRWRPEALPIPRMLPRLWLTPWTTPRGLALGTGEPGPEVGYLAVEPLVEIRHP